MPTHPLYSLPNWEGCCARDVDRQGIQLQAALALSLKARLGRAPSPIASTFGDGATHAILVGAPDNDTDNLISVARWC